MKAQLVVAIAACFLFLLDSCHAIIKQDHPVAGQNDKCISSDGTRHAVGTHWFDPTQCRKYVCRKNNKEEFFIRTVRCEPIPHPLPAGCRKEKKNGHFPRCCPVLVCS